jgi:hypothetical protein
MAEPIPNPFDLFLDRIRQVVREEIAAAANEKSVKLLYTTKEAAGMLNVEESWLAVKARAGLVPCRMLGHYRYFSMADIEAIVSSAAVVNGKQLTPSMPSGIAYSITLPEGGKSNGSGNESQREPHPAHGTQKGD